MENTAKPNVKPGTLLVFLLIIVVALVGLHVFVYITGSASEYSLPMLIIDGAIMMVGILAFASILFTIYDLHDKTQALALPEGSIRAVIAIMMIVMFAIMAIYLFNAVSAGTPKILSGVTENQLTGLRQDQDLRVVSAIRTTPEAPQPSAGENAASIPAPVYDVVIVDRVQTESADIAKQIVVLLGTLVTAITSFYFGSRASATTQGVAVANDMAPALRSVFPKNHAVNDTTTTHLLSGDNLAGANGISLVKNDKTVPARIVARNALAIEFGIDDAGRLEAGIWSLKVEFPNRQPLSLRDALTVTA